MKITEGRLCRMVRTMVEQNMMQRWMDGEVSDEDFAAEYGDEHDPTGRYSLKGRPARAEIEAVRQKKRDEEEDEIFGRKPGWREREQEQYDKRYTGKLLTDEEKETEHQKAVSFWAKAYADWDDEKRKRKITEAKLRRIVRTMIEQVDRAPYVPKVHHSLADAMGAPYYRDYNEEELEAIERMKAKSPSYDGDGEDLVFGMEYDDDDTFHPWQKSDLVAD